ncbi:MAG: nicotinate phosphoribosyltransferase [Deltaproteobacteria bacterium]|uniref:Nicotinate phosphoribosyltransferase n=1 Tax=Candidatus Zymogenus saltonus TaxID=2844893 RepID=A0A9D8KG11_9DELT|nr:nicotinate phosphoribosyltransferase [Candidatus Zymogenus saltonus]
MFYMLSEDEIRGGKVTDVYFMRTKEVLDKMGIKRRVVAEVFAKSLPADWKWAVFSGLEEVIDLLSAHDVKVRSIPEGTIFYPGEPVLEIEGEYTDFGIHETAILGFICQATGIATMAARCRVAAEDRPVISFGARRMHPAIAPMIDRSALIGGLDGVSSVASAEKLNETPVGTMPHALILIIGDTVQTARAFDEIIDKKVNRIVLIDTFNDEKFEAVNVASALKEKLFGVRLDTPGSRRGDFKEILSEVRWELNTKGFSHVKLFASGGLDEYSIMDLNPVCDAYGVGTSISSAVTVDFSFDLVEIEGKPVGKRGKKSGRKDLFRCEECGMPVVVPFGHSPEKCGCGSRLTPFFETITPKEDMNKLPTVREIRSRLLSQLSGFGPEDL